MIHTEVSRARIVFVAVLMIGTVLLYVGFLFRLQVVKGIEFQSLAQANTSRSIVLPAPRGEIYDTDYDTPLVRNVSSFALDIIPAETGDLDAVLAKLASLLNLPVSALADEISAGNLHSARPVEIRNGVPYEYITRIAEHIDEYPGVTWHIKPVRDYDITPSMSHLIGYVGKIDAQELQIYYNKGYTTSSVIGKSGIEYQYEELLKGTDGYEERIVDARGRSITNEISRRRAPVPGRDLVLTIDRDVQRLAEEALGPRIGSVIVMRPATGEILAMVSYPWYDLETFSGNLDVDAYRDLVTDPRSPLLNRAISAQYAPASTFKIIMSVAALEEDAIDPFQEILCTGSKNFGTGVFHCWNRFGHGLVNLGEALAESCNIYFYTLGAQYLKVDTISEYARRMGLGEPTGIDLPEEALGLVPTPYWKENRFNQPWVGGDTVNMSIGQGYDLVTPLQLANMVSMVVNGGVNYVPHLLKEVRDNITGKVLETINPEVLHQSNIRASTMKEVLGYMRRVITDGTARYVITTKAVDIAGKTGTGQVSGYDNSFSSWFAATGPYDAPPEDQLVVIVKTDAVEDWEWWAPRATNILYQGIFAHEDYDAALDSLGWRWAHNPEGWE